MERRPGTPRLLRELNDRAALELLLTGGPMTRAQVGEQTALSKVTASQLLARLEGRGLVEAVGEQAGGPGPNAALYAVVPSSAYVAGLHVEHDEVSAGVADVTGRVVTEIRVDPKAPGTRSSWFAERWPRPAVQREWSCPGCEPWSSALPGYWIPAPATRAWR